MKTADSKEEAQPLCQEEPDWKDGGTGRKTPEHWLSPESLMGLKNFLTSTLETKTCVSGVSKGGFNNYYGMGTGQWLDDCFVAKSEIWQFSYVPKFGKRKLLTFHPHTTSLPPPKLTSDLRKRPPS